MPTGTPGQTLALVYVLNEYRSLLVAGLDAVRDDGRHGTLVDYDGVDKSLALKLGQKGHVVVYVDKIYSPQRLGRKLGGNEEVLVVNGIGLDELRPYAVNQLVLDDGHDLALAEGQLLYHTLGLLAAECRVEEDKTARTGYAVVADMIPMKVLLPPGRGCMSKILLGNHPPLP